jgi:hypothetical protein
MAVNESGWKFDESFYADADLSSYQYHAVKLTSTGMTYSGAGEEAFGILQDDPDTAGEYGRVRILGISQAYVNGNSVNIARGNHLATAASGRLVKATSADECLAIALAAATADGVVIPVLLVGLFYEP